MCKRWQAVIDEMFDMKVKIDESKMNVTELCRFTRVSHCIVSKFVGKVPQQKNKKAFELFCDPTLLKTLYIRGHISRENFWLLTQQCQHVTEWILTGVLLTQQTNMFKTAKLKFFTKGIKKLVATGINILDCNIPSQNAADLLKCQMPILTTLVFRVTINHSEKVFTEKNVILFIKRCRLLETLDLTLRNFLYPSTISAFVIPKLTILKLEFSHWQQLSVWVPFIEAQVCLKRFRLFLSGGFGLEIRGESTILRNKQALEHVDIGVIENSVHANTLLRDNSNLKSLKLQGRDQPKIWNLNSLPLSLETLELYNFECNKVEFEEISNRIPNLITRGIKF